MNFAFDAHTENLECLLYYRRSRDENVCGDSSMINWLLIDFEIARYIDISILLLNKKQIALKSVERSFVQIRGFMQRVHEKEKYQYCSTWWHNICM